MNTTTDYCICVGCGAKLESQSLYCTLPDPELSSEGCIVTTMQGPFCTKCHNDIQDDPEKYQLKLDPPEPKSEIKINEPSVVVVPTDMSDRLNILKELKRKEPWEVVVYNGTPEE